MLNEEVTPVAIPAASIPELLESAREGLAAGRHLEAEALLRPLLLQDPGHAAANALLAEVLVADKRVAQAGPFIDAALAKTPDNLRMQILRGEMLRAIDQPAEADVVFAAVLAVDNGRAGAWSGRIGAALDQRDWPTAVAHLRGGFTVLGDFGLWLGTVRTLAAAGALPELAAAVALLPPPDPADHARFLPWARMSMRIGEGDRLRPLLAQVAKTLPPRTRADYLALRAEVDRDGGDFPAALAGFRLALAQLPDDRWLRRRLLCALLAVGEVDAAETELAVLAASRAPQDDLVAEVGLLQEALRFRASMDLLREAYAVSVQPSLAALAHVVARAPDNPFAAVAFLAALRRQPRERVAAPHLPGIPPCFWSLHGPAPGWRDQHPGAQWQVLAYAPLPPDIEALLPIASPSLRRLPGVVHLDVLRAVTLSQAGGWWYPAQRECRGPLPVAPGPGCRLFLLCDDQGWLVPDCIGSCAGNEVVVALRDQLAGQLHRQADTGHWLTGARLLTLVAARTLAARALRGAPLDDVVIAGEAAFRVTTA